MVYIRTKLFASYSQYRRFRISR